MSYFKDRPLKPLKRPIVYWVLIAQLIVTITAGLAFGAFDLKTGSTILLGGGISILAQSYYNFRALHSYGDRNIGNVMSATYSAMWGKWLILIAISLAAVMKIDELNAGVLYVSLFGVHTLGALLLPILVKRVAS